MSAQNPFDPPRAAVSHAQRRRVAPIWAVLVGVLVDVGPSILVGFILAVVESTRLTLEGLSPAEIEARLVTLTPTSWLSLAGFAIGGGFSFLGAYVCGRLAGRLEYRLAGIMAAVVVSFGLWVNGAVNSTVVHAALTVVTVTSLMLGAWRAAIRNRRGPTPARVGG